MHAARGWRYSRNGWQKTDDAEADPEDLQWSERPLELLLVAETGEDFFVLALVLCSHSVRVVWIAGARGGFVCVPRTPVRDADEFYL